MDGERLLVGGSYQSQIACKQTLQFVLFSSPSVTEPWSPNLRQVALGGCRQAWYVCKGLSDPGDFLEVQGQWEG